MKIKKSVFILILAAVLPIAACQNKQENTSAKIRNPQENEQIVPSIPIIPEGYTVDRKLYLPEGDWIYAFIDYDAIEYEKIGAEICNGNAQLVKKHFEKSDNLKRDTVEYVAVQNILGITEVYLGNYRIAYEYFTDAVDFLNEKNIPEKDKLLTVLYNNAGTVTANLSTNATNDKRLIKAAELCEEPYLGLAIAVNMVGRVKSYATVKEYGVMIARSKEIIEKENQIKNSPNYVLFSAIKFMSVGCYFTGQEEKSIDILNEYIPLVPDSYEYYLTKASLLTYRGQCYDSLKEYENAIKDFKLSIESAMKTVDDNSRQLATTYNQIGLSYMKLGEWETGLNYCLKAVPGLKYANAENKGILYWNLGGAYWQLNQFDNAKEYYLKFYINYQMVIEDLGNAEGSNYGKETEGMLYQL